MPSHVGLLLGQAVDWLPQVGHKTTLFSVALSREGSVGTEDLVSKVLLGLLAFLCHQLNILLPSIFLGQSVAPLFRHLCPGTSSTFPLTTLFPWLGEHVEMLHAASPCRRCVFHASPWSPPRCREAKPTQHSPTMLTRPWVRTQQL